MPPLPILPIRAFMRILLLTQWFQPEQNFKGLPLAQALANLGHEVEVLTGFPNYPEGKLYPGHRIKMRQVETMGGVRVTRAPLYPSHDSSVFGRVLNYSSFAISSALLIFSIRRPDVVYVYCPPMTAATAATALRLIRRVPYVIDVQDLWPDTLVSTGMVKEGTIVKLVGLWSAFAMRWANALIVLSPGFRVRLEERGATCPIHVIPNWAPPEIEEMGSIDSPRVGTHRETFNILFAGNMGKAQSLETVILAAKRLKKEVPFIKFTLIGGGVDVERLKALSASAGTDNIVFLPPRSTKDMASVFREADALLVHLRDDPLFSITIPSKTQAYLAMGLPILMGVRGDAADMLEAAQAGIAFTPEDADSLAESAVQLSAMSHKAREAMGRSGSAFYREHLAFSTGVKAIERVLSAAANEIKEDISPQSPQTDRDKPRAS